MKKLLATTRIKLARWLFEQIDVLRKGENSRYEFDNGCLVSNAINGNGIAILDKSMYVAFERRYKVISKKELRGIVENEKNYHSPFKSGYALYKTTELGDGNWSVQYYFIDLMIHPEIQRYGLILIWEEILEFILGKKPEQSLKVSSPFGEQIAVTEDDSFQIINVNDSSLKNRVLVSEHLLEAEKRNISSSEFTSKVMNYVFYLAWLPLHGAFNRARFSSKKSVLNLEPKLFAAGAAIVFGAMLLESAYLIGLDYYLDSKVQGSAELRNKYSAAKREYLGKLEQFSQLSSVIAAKSNAADIPQLLHQMPKEQDLRIDRMDYIEGEVRIGGISEDIEALMAYLTSHPQVKGLEFMSPITPDKKSGKDRFLIRFDLKHGQ